MIGRNISYRYLGRYRKTAVSCRSNIPNRAHHLRRCQVFSVASVYPIVPAAPSSSSSRLLYLDVTSLLLMNFLITMPLSLFYFIFFYRTVSLYFFFFHLIRCLCFFFNCALSSFGLISVPNPCLTPCEWLMAQFILVQNILNTTTAMCQTCI